MGLRRRVRVLLRVRLRRLRRLRGIHLLRRVLRLLLPRLRWNVLMRPRRRRHVRPGDERPRRLPGRRRARLLLLRRRLMPMLLLLLLLLRRRLS